MTQNTPLVTQKLFSTVHSDGRLTLQLQEATVPAPGRSEVVIAVEATPVNPVDMMTLWPGMDLSRARRSDSGALTLDGFFPGTVPEALHSRLNTPLVPGLEGAGTVVATGRDATHLAGKRVAATSLQGGMYARHCTVAASDCEVLPDHITTRQGSSFFTNPLTVAAILEVLQREDQRALIHTAAASSLGQMLARACAEDGIDLVAVIRNDEQAGILRQLDVRYICNLTSPDFRADLVRAARETGAMIAFDAIGGGDSIHHLLAAMTSAYSPAEGETPYGARSRKKVLVYGRLDPSPPRLAPSAYGALWTVEGWAMPEIFELAGAERMRYWRERILNSLDSTFASHFSRTLSLADLLEPEILAQCFKQQTGGKALLIP